MEVINNEVCSVCGLANSELVIFHTKILWFLPKEIDVCQKCISKAFRSFKKKK